jgi:hypothetical protein
MFESVADVKGRLREARYLCNDEMATVVYLADRLGKPLLVEGQRQYRGLSYVAW